MQTTKTSNDASENVIALNAKNAKAQKNSKGNINSKEEQKITKEQFQKFLSDSKENFVKDTNNLIKLQSLNSKSKEEENSNILSMMGLENVLNTSPQLQNQPTSQQNQKQNETNVIDMSEFKKINSNQLAQLKLNSDNNTVDKSSNTPNVKVVRNNESIEKIVSEQLNSKENLDSKKEANFKNIAPTEMANKENASKILSVFDKIEQKSQDLRQQLVDRDLNLSKLVETNMNKKMQTAKVDASSDIASKILVQDQKVEESKYQSPFNHKLDSSDPDVKDMGLMLGSSRPGNTWMHRTALNNIKQEELAYDALQKMKDAKVNKPDGKHPKKSIQLERELGDVKDGLQAVVDSFKKIDHPAKAGIAELKTESSDINSTGMKKQVEMYMDMLMFRPNQKIKVVLQPEHLGSIEMIAKDINGKMEIEMLVQKSDTLSKLQSSSQELIEKVSETSGIQIGQIKIKSAENSAENQNNTNNQNTNLAGNQQESNDHDTQSSNFGPKEEGFVAKNSSQNQSNQAAHSNRMKNNAAGNTNLSTLYGGQVSIKV